VRSGRDCADNRLPVESGDRQRVSGFGRVQRARASNAELGSDGRSSGAPVHHPPRRHPRTHHGRRRVGKRRDRHGAGAGLPLLAGVVTALHFVIVYGYTWLRTQLPGLAGESEFAITCIDGQGVLRRLLTACTDRPWSITSLTVDPAASRLDDATPTAPSPSPCVSGAGVDTAPAILGGVDGLVQVHRRTDEGD
jgi:hypothetical protein